MNHTQRIGVISDTHGLLRPEAVSLLTDVDLILHAGDIGKLQVLDGLKKIAPLTAVRGNVDRDGGTQRLPANEAVEVLGHWLYLLHNLDELDFDPATAGFSAVIFGHSHQPSISRRDGVLYFNPGSAGPRRFSLPITLGFIDVSADDLEARLVEL